MLLVEMGSSDSEVSYFKLIKSGRVAYQKSVVDGLHISSKL